MARMYLPTIRGVLLGAPCPGHSANQPYQITEAGHLREEAPEASDLQMPEGRSVNVNAPQPAKEALRPSEQEDSAFRKNEAISGDSSQGRSSIWTVSPGRIGREPAHSEKLMINCHYDTSDLRLAFASH